jgi:hypothetical protein
MGAMDSHPETEAELRRVAKRTGVSLLAARIAPDEVKRQARVQDMGLDGMAGQFPSTARWLLDQDNARLAHDDIGALSAVERAVKAYSGAFGQGLVGQSIGGTLRGLGELYDISARAISKPLVAVGGDGVRDFLTRDRGVVLSPAEVFLARPGRALGAVGESMRPAPENSSFGTDVASGLVQLTGQIAVQALTGGVASSATLFGQGADVMASKVRTDNASQDAKDSAALVGAAITGITEKYALDKILGPMALPIKNATAASCSVSLWCASTSRSFASAASSASMFTSVMLRLRGISSHAPHGFGFVIGARVSIAMNAAPLLRQKESRIGAGQFLHADRTRDAMKFPCSSARVAQFAALL